MGKNLTVDKINKRIEVWSKDGIEVENELGEVSYKPSKLRTIWAGIIPQTGNLIKQSNADTLLANTTHKIIVRYNAGKDIKDDMWIIYKEHQFDINYILNPYFRNETLEIFCTESIE